MNNESECFNCESKHEKQCDNQGAYIDYISALVTTRAFSASVFVVSGQCFARVSVQCGSKDH